MIKSPSAPQQPLQPTILVITAYGHQEIADVLDSEGLVQTKQFPDVPSDLASNLSARVELRQRIANHTGKVVVDKTLDISPHFLAACII